MAETLQAAFTLEHIFKICSERNQPGDPGIGHIVSPSTYTDTWNTFYKWIKTQLDQGRTVSVPSFANVSARQGEDKESFVYTQLNSQFLSTYGLSFRSDLPDMKQPIIKLNLNVMARLADNLDPQIAGVALSRVISIIGEILATYENVEINLGQFGRLYGHSREVVFAPAVKSKGNKLQSKQTVKTLLDSNLGLKYSFNAKKTEGSYNDGQPPALDSKNGTGEAKGTTPVKEAKGLGLSPVRKVQDPYFSGNSNLTGHVQSFLSPNRKNVRHEVIPEMIMAGSDPLAKEQEFSHLISKPKELMSTKFVKPPNAKVRFPPVIDSYARTIAAPISHTKFSLSVTGRIASNYTQSTKYLQVDMEAKVIKSIKPKESKIQLSANPEFLEEPASEDEELVYVLLSKERTHELEKKVKARATSYNRYRQYVLSEIPIDCIAPIRQYWINDILDLIPAEYPFLDRTTVEILIDRMLNEINKDYYDSGRKSILDYVLKEEDEKQRLGIMQILEEPLDYGENIYAGLEPDDVWKETVGIAKADINDRLVIWSDATLNFKELWTEYEAKLFVTLPNKEEKPLYIEDFVKLQNKTLADVKNALVSEWVKNVQKIYKSEINQMNKKQAYIFFEANATLMSNQIRKLITDSVLAYRDFFRRFQKPTGAYKLPQKIIEEEKDYHNSIEDVFLVVRMIFNEGAVAFANALGDIRQDLLRIIENIVNVSDKFSRAEINIARSEKVHLWPMTLEDELIQDVFKEVDEIINNNLAVISKVTQVFDNYIFLLTEEERVQHFIAKEPTREEFRAEIKKYMDAFDSVNRDIPFYIHMPMVMIDCTDVKKELLRTCEKLIDDLVAAINKLVFEKNGTINRTISSLKDSIRDPADEVETLVRLEQTIDRIKEVQKGQIEKDFRDLTLWLLMLYDTNHKVSEDDIARVYRTSLEVKSIDGFVDENQNRIRDERTVLENKLTKQRQEFMQNLESIGQQIDGLNEFATTMVYRQANERITDLKTKLAEYEAEKEDINHKEDLLGIPLTSFDKLSDVMSAIKPYEDLWRLVKDFYTYQQQWTREKPLLKLDPEVVEKETKQMLTLATKMTLIFTKSNPKPWAVAQKILQEIKEFNVHVPLVSCLCNPGLKERHWKEIYDLGLQKNPGKDLYLWMVVESQLHSQLTKIQDISDSAGKEYTNEKILTKMNEDWQPMVCEIKAWKETGTFVIGGATVDEAQQILDDQIVKTQTMKGSPYAKIFEERINEWENWLKYTQDVLDYWVKVQSVWLYLEPVFSSDDIMKQMPVEGAKFKEVDNNWRIIMSKINANPKMTEVMKNKKLLDNFKEAHESLEVVQKGLNSYLESKRTAFPRFYFLSSDELLEILSETKDPTRVQPHLKKCFEGINKLKFDEQKRIHSMYSSEGEEVPLVQVIDAMAARGAVELWLIQVEDMMIASIRDVIEKSFNDYRKMNRSDWVLDRCGQAVLTISMTYWTYEVEGALRDRGLEGLKDSLAQCESQIKDVVRLIKGDISFLNRATLEALIVLDVHNKDVVKNLVDSKISDVNDFLWFSQLRYYWENNDTVVRIVNATVQYNYEYLGNSPRLVITPLTDRCYRTLCGAINLNYGGAPEGPAGTGKTETVKDLAKALARQCVVFNCSDGLDYKAMGKFFKGLASSGAWSCFDEFNRIDLEVLSVIAQQILTIQIAVAEKKSSFDFEGSHIKLKLTANCFITMNPGYAGRSELPDNLKALFRSVAMMVPDYALIAEISLYSFGFEKARTLAQKIVTTYKLCSEQLSSQDHYDYGMRAVKSVLTAAGNLLRKFPNEDEYILVLRAINDVNLAKFLSFDLPLFKGITSDLFPGVELPAIDYSALLDAIDNQIKIMKLQKKDYFIEKIIQLYEMIRVRHGLMVVGYPFAGKTSITKVLAAALGELQTKNLMDEKKVQLTYLNPKSISMKQLYGYNDEATQEWTDGVLAVKYKAFSKSETEDRKWLIFDGPIDAVWIENMNTVLDDNKKLCLNSGEIIAMSKSMNMIFEPMDLLAASPATVSRCGMVYLEPASMGWRPMFESWKENSLPKTFGQEEIFRISELFDQYIDPLLKYHRKSLVETSPTQDQNLVQACMRIMGALLKPFADEQYFNSIELKNRLSNLDNLFVFALTWSLGGSVASQSRRGFDVALKKIAGGEGGKKKLNLPDKQMFEYIFTIPKGQEEGTWTLWTDLINPNEIIPAKMQAQEIIVKTTDTVRYSYLVDLYLRNDVAGLFCGPTGTGKSVYIKSVLNQLPKESYMVIDMAFSAQTSSNQTQEIVDGNLTRRKKGYFGPPIGKRCILFVDDLNMPAKEKYGAQPPIEILRQLLDQGGWYDLKDKERPFANILDLTFIAAMGPPGGGRTFVTPRIVRHLNLVSFTNFDDETLKRIFNTILHWYFSNNGFPQELIKLENKIVSSTLEIYQKAIEDLRPTPMKSHYLFNLRDFAKVILGICMSDKDKTSEPDQMIRLWMHEVWRVFADRLVSDEDKMIFFEHIKESVRKTFGVKFDSVFARLDNNGDGKVDRLDEIRGLMFTDVMSANQVRQFYEEVTDFSKLQESVEGSLANYNLLTDKPMDLVMFSFAVEHLLIIARIIKQPGGNALLIGVGGSGRQSLTRLAAHIKEYQVNQIEISKNYGKNEWRDDLKLLLKNAGGKGNPTVFLFTDSQIKEESFVEDINTLLNSGEVPNLYAPDEKAEIMEMVRASARSENKAPDGTPSQLFGYFVERVKKMLHIVLCFSPIGEALRNRIRMFPSLVNCCTIDWFSAWPNDALYSVAKKFVKDIEMEPSVKEQCEDMLQFFHVSTVTWSEEFFKSLKRKYYVTPTSYLEMIITFKTLLGEKRKEILANKNKYVNGYEKIIVTESLVGEMQQSLTDLKPKLEKASKDTEIKLQEVSVQKGEADKVKAVVSGEEEICKRAADAANAIKSECEAELEKALPMVREAEKALEVLQKKDMDEVRGYKIPPNPVKLTCQAVIMLTKKVQVPRKPNPKTGEMELQWWEASVKMLSDGALLEYLIKFSAAIDDLDEPTVRKLGDFLNENSEALKPDTVKAASTAAHCLIVWVRGIYNYYFVNKEVKPKKEKLAKAEGEARGLLEKLAVKQKQLKEVVDKVDKLTRELNEAERNKDKLEKQYNDVLKKLDRATKLIDSLGSEKGRWSELGTVLAQVYIDLTGDILVASGMIAYLGAFTSAFRTQITDQWVKRCKEHHIPSSESFALATVLGDPVKIRDWNIFGLPSDSFSVENGIIISKSRRWPLCIDPQGQANKWIKNMEKSQKISITKLSDADLIRTLENSIQFGKPVLIENVYEDLDPSLTPILLKQTYQKGNTVYLKLGDQTLEYNPNFRLYITTKLRNPHYLPEISTKVTLLNFMITLEGLNDQLLGIVVKKERPELEKEKERLIIEGANNKRRLQELEAEILKVLSEAKNILEDEKGVEILTASKVTSNEIKEKQTIAEQTEKDIDAARTLYKPVSNEASCLFFAITDLANIDPMYQYSLAYFIDLFTQAITKSEQSSDLEVRLTNLKTYFLYSLYSNICRSLFEKDKLLFSFLLSTRLKDFRKELNGEQYRFLLTGGVSLGQQMPEKPHVPWLSDKAWAEIFRMSDLDHMQGFFKSFKENISSWKTLYDSPNPHKEAMPEPQESNLAKFEKLLILRALRPDKMIPAVQDFVAADLGHQFIDPPAFDLEKVYQDSSSTTPLIFVLSPGSDPFANLFKFAEKMNKKVVPISLGQGQGEKAQLAIKEGAETGGWVVLQNCHLAIRWMPTLEKICEELNPDPKFTHPEFRLWLTSYPSPDFPVAILQNGVKMTNEPPKGLRANLLRSYFTDPISDPNFFESCRRSNEFKKLLYGLCFFHAVIQERRKFGPLGWNIPYEFTDSDLRISVRQLHMFLHDQGDVVPFDALKYLTAECNYGGRVTDDKDRRLITTLLDDFYNQHIVSNPNYTFSTIQFYKAPTTTDHKETVEFIKGFPLIVEPEVFGLHANADITKDIGETNLLLDSLLLCQSESGSSEAGSFEETLKKLVDTIRSDFPGPFDTQKASEKYPVSYKESMNTVLTQELVRFNNLIKVVISSLENIRDALDGKILLSSQLERASKSLYDGKVPEMWMEKSYPSLKPLGGYIKNLKERIAFFRKWIDEGQPVSYWLSGFFFTQSFLTGVLQNFARKYTIAIDLIKFDFDFFKEEPTERPANGANVYGLFIEGAKWNNNTMKLDESDPKTLFVECPAILLKPTENPSDYPHYLCPVYKTSARRGTLSTTGHSTNFVMMIRLPSDKPESHWVKRGVALLTQLDD